MSQREECPEWLVLANLEGNPPEDSRRSLIAMLISGGAENLSYGIFIFKKDRKISSTRQYKQGRAERGGATLH